jgi:hypothetical protein
LVEETEENHRPAANPWQTEKIKMWKVNGQQTTDNGRQVMAKAHVAFGKVS